MTITPPTKFELARQIRSGQHIPDILDCLAQLSNDQVPTPPKLARRMLDSLPSKVWGEPDNTWLDPFSKSGIFLREIAARLLEGLSDEIPDFHERRNHIYRHMLWGTSVTEMTGMISRRSLYYSRDASGKESVAGFDTKDGNLPFIRSNHDFGSPEGKACLTCKAPRELERGHGRENYAYSFIHNDYPTKEMKNMKFDVIVGNPPYQIDSDGNTRTMPIYQHFVTQAIELKPRYVLMITPSRWFGGGLGLDEFRASMLRDSQIRKIVDYPKLFECFPAAEIKGGVSYFLWEKGSADDCEIVSVRDGIQSAPMIRPLSEFDVLVRDNDAIPVLRKVRDAQEMTLDREVASRVPFGLQANFKRYESSDFPGAVKVFGNKFVGYTKKSEITKNSDWVSDWKVLIPKATDGHGRIPALVTPAPIVAAPGEICTDTYLVVWRTTDSKEAHRFARYMETKFVRLLIHLRKLTQDNKPSTFAFVPMLPMDREWSDADLYARYNLTDEEIAHVESQIKETVLRAGEES